MLRFYIVMEHVRQKVQSGKISNSPESRLTQQQIPGSVEVVTSPVNENEVWSACKLYKLYSPNSFRGSSLCCPPRFRF